MRQRKKAFACKVHLSSSRKLPALTSRPYQERVRLIAVRQDQATYSRKGDTQTPSRICLNLCLLSLAYWRSFVLPFHGQFVFDCGRISSRSTFQRLCRLGSSRSFNFFTYAEHYPPALCVIDNEVHANSCVYDRNVTGFTTHGLW